MELVRGGITTVLISPEPLAPVSGQITAWKLSGGRREEVSLKDYAALLVRNDLPAQELRKIKEYHERWKAYEAKKPPEGEAPERQEAYEPFRPLLEKKLPVVLFAASPAPLLEEVRLLSKEYGLRVIACGPARLDQIAVELRREGAEALLTVPFLLKDADSLKEVNLPESVARAGLPFAFSSRAAGGAAELLPQVAFAVRRGLSAREALEALTMRPARFFGLDERVGSLEEGKDADLVFLSGEPFSLDSRVAGVMVDGDLRFLEGVK
jgi:imidazolonepropionase-like amidohydrolase